MGLFAKYSIENLRDQYFIQHPLTEEEANLLINAVNAVRSGPTRGYRVPMMVVDTQMGRGVMENVVQRARGSINAPIGSQAPIRLTGTEAVITVLTLMSFGNNPDFYNSTLTEGQKNIFRDIIKSLASELTAWDPIFRVAETEARSEVNRPVATLEDTQHESWELIGQSDQTKANVVLDLPNIGSVTVTHPERILWHRVRKEGIESKGGPVRTRPLLTGEGIGEPNLNYTRTRRLIREILPHWEDAGLVLFVDKINFGVKLTPKGALVLPTQIPF